MESDVRDAPARRDVYPLVRILASFPIACFTCTLLTDIAYAQTANIMWANFSAWLLAVGMAGGVMAAVAGMAAWIIGRRGGPRPAAWTIGLGSVLALVIALFNNFVHSRDAWTSVMPAGLALSAITVVVMLATAWLAAITRHRRAAAVSYSGVRR